MVHKKKVITFKMNFHKATKKKTSNASGMNHKTNSSQLVNAKALPRVNVSLTRLMPTKMPDIAKEQYYNLVKSSGLLSVMPLDNTVWNAMSPEATPEREDGKSSHNSEILSPITRTQLQLSPLDLDEDYADLSNEPWSDSLDPYPSPKSPERDENDESDNKWFISQTRLNKPRLFECEEVNELSCRNPVAPCDSEVEAIMARQNCQVPESAPGIPVHRPHLSSGLLQTIVIPLQQVEKSILDVCRDDSPVFEKNGIWTTPGRKLSMEKENGTAGTKDLKRKRGTPQEQRKVPQVIISKDLSNSSDEVGCPSPLAHGAQENTAEGKRNCEKTSFENVTEFQSEKTSVEKGAAKKRGRPKKRRRLHSVKSPALNVSVDLISNEDVTKFQSEKTSVEKGVAKKRGRPKKRRRLHSVKAPALNVSVDLISNDRAESTLLPEPEAENHEIRSEEETSQSKNRKNEGVSPETTVNNNLSSQEKLQVSTDVEERNSFEYREDYLNSQSLDHGTKKSATPNDHMPVLIDIESTPSEGSTSDSYLVGEVEGDEIQVEDDERVEETPVTTPKINKWLSSVKIESSPLIESLELINIQNGSKSPTRATVFLQDKEEKRRLTSNSESINESIPQERLRTFRQELFPGKELSANVKISNCNFRDRTPSEESTSDQRTSSRPLEFRFSTSSMKDMPILSNGDRPAECQRICERRDSTLKDLSVICERLPNNVLDNNIPYNDSIFLKSSASKGNVNNADEVTEPLDVSKRSFRFEPGLQTDRSPLLSSSRERPILNLNGKDRNSGQEQGLLEGNVRLVPCSPIQISKSPFFEKQRKRSSSFSIESSSSDTLCNGTITFTAKSNTSSKELKSSCHEQIIHTGEQTPTCSKVSNTSLLDGIIPLTPIPVEPVQMSSLRKSIEGKERRNSTNSAVTNTRNWNSPVMLSPLNGFKSPVPLKDLVVKCDRVRAGDYNVLKCPENLLVKRPKPKRKKQKVNTGIDAGDKKEKAGKNSRKRKREKKSNKSEKPRKKRKLSIPDHYRNYKPCQLPTISHTNMRYRVAFQLWPRMFSGALDRINQRLTNQNSFWNSL